MTDIGKHELIKIVSYNSKLYDINHADTNARTCSIAANIPPNCTGLFLYVIRQSGSGNLAVYMNSASNAYTLGNSSGVSFIPIVNQELKYEQDNANDDFDLYVLCYTVRGPVAD